MTDNTEQGRRTAAALSGLTRAIAPGADDYEHPSHDVLEAFVDGALDDADREWVSSHAEICAQCLDDIGDLTRLREALSFELSARPAAAPAAPPAARTSPLGRWAAAAAMVIAVGGGGYWWAISRAALPATSPVTDATTSAAPSASAPAPDPLTADERARVNRALATGVIDLPGDVRALARPSGTLLGDAGARAATLAPISPVGTAVASPTPSFAWSSVTGATRYDVAVFDDQFNEVASGAGVTGTSWTPVKPLPRGRVLSWQVTAHIGDRTVMAPTPPQPEARFRVADAATAASADADRQRLANEPLALAVVLANKGLVADAVKQLERAATDPASADRARTLLAELRGRR